MRLPKSLRLPGLLGGLALLAACADATLPDGPPEPMGNFRLGHNIVVADNAQMSPVSRRAEPEEWEEALEGAIDARLGRYEGEGLFHVGVGVNGYALAPPGIPLVVSPKSVLIVTVNVWDNSTQEKLTEEGKRFTVFEGASPETFIGSGLTQTKAQQIEKLSRNAAARIHAWLLENPDWFGMTGESEGEEGAEDETPTDA